MATVTQLDGQELPAGVTCGICHNDRLQSVGELDCCFHRFCFPCILQWSQIESRCPFCKARFMRLVHRRLSAAARKAQDPGQANLDGTVLEVLEVPERDQGADEPDPMAGVICMHCGSGEDDNLLLLCDGCDRAMHTFCANLMAVPEGEWYCPECVEAQVPLMQHSARTVPIMLDVSDSEGDAAYEPDLGSGAAAAAEGAGSAGRHSRGRRRGSLVSARQLRNGSGSAADGGAAAAAAAGQHPLEDLEDRGPGAGAEDEDELLLLAPQPRFTGSTQPRHGQSTASRSRRRLIRGSERTVGGARGAVADMVRRVGDAAAAADELPSNAHRQVQAMRDTFEARRQADIAEEEARARSAEAAAGRNLEAAVRSGEVVARRAAAAEASGPSTRGGERSAGGTAAGGEGGSGGVNAGGSGGQRSVSAAFRQELAEASAAASVRNVASPQFKRPTARRATAPSPAARPSSQPAKWQPFAGAASPPRSPRLASPPRSPQLVCRSGDPRRTQYSGGGSQRHADAAAVREAAALRPSGKQSRWEAAAPVPSPAQRPLSNRHAPPQPSLPPQHQQHQQQQAAPRQAAPPAAQQPRPQAALTSNTHQGPPPPLGPPAQPLLQPAQHQGFDAMAAAGRQSAVSPAAAAAVPPPPPSPLPPVSGTAAGPALAVPAAPQQQQHQPPQTPGCGDAAPPPQQPKRQRRPWPSIADRSASPAVASPHSAAGSPKPSGAAASPAAAVGAALSSGKPTGELAAAPKQPLPWLQNRGGDAQAQYRQVQAAAAATSVPAPPTPPSWPPPPQSPGASVATSTAVAPLPPPPLPPAAATSNSAAATGEVYSPTRDAIAGVNSSSAPAATGSANSTAGVSLGGMAGISEGATGGSDASGDGKKRRPLDAALTGDQLRHARKRRMKETAPAVKDMLKPMYATKALDKEAFKLVAAAATAELAETVEVADMTADDVHDAVQRALEPLGLSLLD